MSTIYIFRHGQTDFNRDHKFTGWLDAKLTDLGRQQAEVIANQLREKTINLAFQTRLSRSIETLDIVIKSHPECQQRITDDRLIERSYGDLSGHLHSEIISQYGQNQFDLWHRSYSLSPPGGESIKDVEKRVNSFIKDLLKLMKKEKVNVEEKEIDAVIEDLKGSQKTKEKEINDKWATEIGKLLGDEKIDTVEKLKEKIKESLQIQKEHTQLHQLQDQALKIAIELSKIDLPQPAIDFEARERERYFNEDMKSKSIKIEDFLKANNITIEKMRELWLLDAKEAIQADVFLNLYADTKDVKVTDEELNKKIEVVKKNQPDADPSIFSNDEWKEYVRGVERKEKAFRVFIEEVLGKDSLDSHN